jgi:hypothetical protein
VPQAQLKSFVRAVIDGEVPEIRAPGVDAQEPPQRALDAR